MHDINAIVEPNPRWKSRVLPLIAVAFLLCMGAALRVASLNGVARRTPDERVYTAAGQTLLVQGIAGIPELEARVAADTKTAANPVRAGYLYLLAESMRLTGRTDERAGADLACASSMVTLLLLATMAWRRFSTVVALTALLLYAVSPAALMTARRSWEEAVAEAVAMVLIFAASEITAGSRHWAWALVVASAGAFCITIKQTAALSFALCAVWVLVVLILRGERRSALRFAALFAIATLASVCWLTYVVGGWSHFVTLLAGNTNSLDGNDYSIAFEAGSPWQLLKAFEIISATTLVLALIAFAGNLRRLLTTQRQIILALFAMCAIYIVLMTILPHHINLRYVAPMFAPAALLAGAGMAFLLGLRRFAGPEQSGLLGTLAVIALVSMAAVDYHHFRTKFADPDVQDLSLRMVLAAGDEPLPPQPEQGVAHWLALSAQASQAGDCPATIDAANHAIQLDPGSAVAWNDLAAGFECARLWPSAIDAAQHALKLQPDFQLARNNLNWSLDQQRKQAPK